MKFQNTGKKKKILEASRGREKTGHSQKISYYQNGFGLLSNITETEHQGVMSIKFNGKITFNLEFCPQPIKYEDRLKIFQTWKLAKIYLPGTLFQESH